MRLDKYLKVSRLIKRRTVANEACDAGRVTVNDRVAKASLDVKVGDVIQIAFGTYIVKQAMYETEVLCMEGNIKHAHKVSMSNRSKLEMTGISDVVSFDLTKVLLESDYGVITIKGQNLHVNRLSVEKGELDIDGTIQAIEYSDKDNFSKKGESWFGKLLK